MKKIFVFICCIAFLIPGIVNAATITSDFATTFSLNQTRGLAPITITATAENEITVQNGISLFLIEDPQMLWDSVQTLTATGSAVTNGKIAAKITAEYQDNYQVLHIPVLANFAAGESVTISGTQMRAYHKVFSRRYLQLDLNGDGISDAEDTNKIEIQDVLQTDFTAPYAPGDFKAELSADLKQINLSWQLPPDYDQTGTNLDRSRVRNGNPQIINVLSNTPFINYTDTDILTGDVITYTLTSSDGRNSSDPVIITIEVKAPDSVVQSPSDVTPPDSTTPEIDSLNNLYTYYKIRYSIKCYPSGHIVSEGDSACLWAKIDIVYTQEKLGKDDIQTSLSDYNKTIIAKRIPYSEARYQTYCADAATPATYCPALEKALARAHYLLEQE